MIKTAILTALLLASASTFAAPIKKLEITGGSFSANGGHSNELILGDFANMTVGGFDGSNPELGDFTGNSIAYYYFDTYGPVGIVTTPASYTSSGFAAPTGDITDGVATLELDSWSIYVSWGLFNMGSTSDKGAAETCKTRNDFVTNCSTAVIVDSYDAATGEFTASWDSVFTEGPLSGSLGNWNISGIMSTSAIPVPAAVWLFGSGLIALTGIARRRKFNK